MHRSLALAAGAVGAVALSTALATTTVNTAAGPTGTHLQNGSPQPGCTADDLTVTCNAFQLGGVGNTDATVTLNAEYSATVDCTNKGGNLVEVKSKGKSGASGTFRPDRRNGELRVGGLTVSPNTQSILNNADCPNGNWTPSIQEGTLVLVSFTYILHFNGFTGDYLTITEP